MCFHIGSQRHSRDRSPSPPPRPSRRSRHSPEVSNATSSSTRRRRRTQDPEVNRHHARRSIPLIFAGESSSAQTPRHDKSRGKSRRKRHHPNKGIQNWAAAIPEGVEDVEDPDPPVPITTRQGKQPEPRGEDPADEGETKKSEDQAGNLLKKSSPKNKKPPRENDKSESSKTKVDTKDEKASKLSMDTNTPTKPSKIEIPESSKTAGQSDAQKAAAARKLPVLMTETVPPPAPDPPLSIHTTSASSASTPVTAEHGNPSSVAGSGGDNKEKGTKYRNLKDDDADAVSVRSLPKVKGLFGKKK